MADERDPDGEDLLPSDDEIEVRLALEEVVENASQVTTNDPDEIRRLEEEIREALKHPPDSDLIH